MKLLPLKIRIPMGLSIAVVLIGIIYIIHQSMKAIPISMTFIIIWVVIALVLIGITIWVWIKNKKK